ncbi:bacterioferritin [Desulfallas thermosapovorans DSM 6562]|uniref:Bacterioferritin n=2 Tax=Desulfallas thermosapovorans TaxID=58137 RepID=A0A5S4ZWI4_9FIRM|nr:bacterioferritin [Desulfallas thermosapovorans DSM 6562]
MEQKGLTGFYGRGQMDEETIISKLNWFYSLELNQVDLYTAQAHAVKDIYLAKSFARIAMIEQQHVDNLAEEIKRRGGKPTSLGDVVSPLLGKAAGTFSGLLGPRMMLKMDITLEEKAMQDYKNMIMQVGNDKRLFDVLWDNLIDEDLHAAWFANKLKELER